MRKIDCRHLDNLDDEEFESLEEVHFDIVEIMSKLLMRHADKLDLLASALGMHFEVVPEVPAIPSHVVLSKAKKAAAPKKKAKKLKK